MKKEDSEDDEFSISLPASSEDEESKPPTTGKRAKPEDAKVHVYLYHIA